MATNIKYPGPGVTLRMTVGATVVSGDLVEFVDLHGVALTSYASADGKADVKFPFMFVADLSVHAANNSGNVAVSIGDKLYYDAAETPDEINKDSTNGKAFGYALEAITSGETDTILVGIGL